MIWIHSLTRGALIAALWLVCTPSRAEATHICEGKELLLTVTGHTKTFGINMLKNDDMRVHLPSGIKRVTAAEHGPLIVVEKEEKDVLLRFAPNTPIGEVAGVRVWSEKGFTARLDVTYVDATRSATEDITIMHITEVEHERARIDGLVREQVEENERQAALRRLERVQGRPVVDRSHRQDGPISVQIHRAEWEGDLMYVYFTATSHVMQPRRLGAVAALDVHGEPIVGTRVYFAKDERTDTPDAIASATPGVKPVDVLIKGKGSEKGLMVIPAASDSDRDMFGLRLYGAGQAMLTESILQKWWLEPVTQEQWEREQRAKQTTVSVRLLGGGFWTTAGDDLGGLDGTSLAGLAVRIQKGYGWGGAFEAEIVGARSSDARFQDVPWSGMTGDVRREATLGRAAAGFAVRFGDRYVSSARVGVGLQVASYDSTFTMNNTPMPGPGDGFEVDGVWFVGGGFDVRLGGNWGLGASATFTSTVYDGPRSLEGGLHLGYGWN